MFRLKNIFCFIFLIAFGSCGLLDNDKPVPFFLDLKEPTVRTPDNLGFDTHKITDVWVFADGQILGVFPLPAKVPLTVNNADSEITILAGIRNNGMNDTPVFYPFYKSIVTKVSPEANKIISIPLHFQYISNAKIPVNESFETGNSFWLDFDNNSDSNIKITDQTAHLGLKSGWVTLTNELKFMEVGSANNVNIGQNSRGQSYIEMDYKGEGEIAVGIAKSSFGLIRVEYLLYVPGKENWNKIYIDVTDKLSPNDYESYRLVLGFTRTGISQISNIYVDNIKHIHF
jgi:hypothetical protein